MIRDFSICISFFLCTSRRRHTSWPRDWSSVVCSSDLAEIKAHLEAEGKPEDDPHGEEVREDTEKAMRDQFILDALAENFEVQVGQNELLEFLLSTSRQYGMDPNEFIQSAGQAGQIPEIGRAHV